MRAWIVQLHCAPATTLPQATVRFATWWTLGVLAGVTAVLSVLFVPARGPVAALDALASRSTRRVEALR